MKILHTADIHLGSNTYGRIDPQTGLNTRLQDFTRAFDRMVERALEEDVDVFLFCGDAYRTADPTPTQQRAFAECLRPVLARGIPVVMIIGNHDHPVSFGKASALDIFGYLGDQVRVFRRPDAATIETKSGPLQLIALPWPIRSILLSKDEHRRKSPLELRAFIEETYTSFVRVAAEELDPDLPTVLAAHLTVQGAEMSGSERTSLIAHEPKFTVGQLAVPPIDYVALGHIHRPQNRNDDGGIPVVYCGSIERISFKEWEDRKGYVLVQIEGRGAEKRTAYEFIETGARPFVSIHVDAREAAEPTKAIVAEIEQHPLEEAIVRVRYHVDEAQVPLIDVQQIRDALAGCAVIASIERTVDPIERQQRTRVTRESSLEEAMRQYISQHDHLTSLQDDLVQAALELEATYMASRASEP